jgi:hypothetical protein
MGKTIENLKIYTKATLLFVVISSFITFPIFNLSLSFGPFSSLYPLLSYFIVIIALSISYYFYFKELWRFKINYKIILFYLLIIQYFGVGLVITTINGLLGINYIDQWGLFAFGLVYGSMLFFMDIFLVPYIPLSRWFSRNYSGKALSFEKKFRDADEFNNLIKLLRRSGGIFRVNSQVLIYDTPFFTAPTYFLSKDDDKKIMYFQISQQSGFSSIVNDKIRDFKEVVVSLGFKYVGESEIRHDLYNPKLIYPRFARSRKLSIIWILIIIATYSINKVSIEKEYPFTTLIYNKILVLYTPINEFTKENPIVLVIFSVVGTLIFTKFENIKSAFIQLVGGLKKGIKEI